MQGLVHITHEVNQVFQSVQSLFIGRIAFEDGGLGINGAYDAFPVRAVPAHLIGAAVPGEVDVVPGCCGGVTGFIGPGGNRHQGSARFEGQEAFHLVSGLRCELGHCQAGNDLVSLGAPSKDRQVRDYQGSRQNGG